MTLWAETQSVLEGAFTIHQAQCVSVCVCKAENGIFICLRRCVCLIFNARHPGCMHVCQSVREAIGIPSPSAIRGQTDPIMFVLGDQIGLIPSRPAACRCSFQPVWMDYSIHFMLWTCSSITGVVDFRGLFGCCTPEWRYCLPGACFVGFRDKRFNWSESWNVMKFRENTVAIIFCF